MSNFDERGAYTPREEPLAFDARQPGGRSGGRAPTTLIISAAVLILLAAGVFFYYRSGVRHQGDAPRVLGQPVGEMSSAPPATAQPSDTAESLAVYNTEQAQPSDTQPKFAPQPEQPMARPAPPPAQPAPQPTLQTARPPTAPSPDVKPTVQKKTAPTPVAVAKPRTSPETAPATPMMTAAAGNTTRAPAALAAAHAPPAAAKAATPKPAAAASGPALVQIGAFTTAAQADKGWQDAARLVPGDMAGRGKRVEPVDVGGKTFQRTYVTGFASKEAAKAFCAKLRAAGASCIVR